MKKMLLIGLGMMIVMFANAQNAKILRHHNGVVTQYNAAQVSIAMSEAIDGDTLYFSDGIFDGFTISKAVTIIGTGTTTRISGSVSVSIPNTPTLTSRLLDAVNISGTLEVKSAVNGMNVRKCTISNVLFSGNVSETVFDRCNITSYMKLSSYVMGLTATNCYLYYLCGSANTPDFASFINCNIYGLSCLSSSGGVGNSSYPAFKGNLINSIIYRNMSQPGNYNSTYYLLSSAVYMTNCLYCSYDLNTSDAVVNKCYKISSSSDFVSSYMGSNTANLSTYLGNDGTIVGMYGGTTPYNLTPSTPTVTSSNITVDTTKKELNVSIKVQANN